MFALYTLSTLTLLASLLPSAESHMGLWHPSAYGFDEDYEPVTPLANKPFSQWWFHGYAYKQPQEVMTIIPGQTLNVQLACSKSYSTWGNSPSSDACPGDSGAFHAGGTSGSSSGWAGNSDANLMGCALAIAPKSKAADVKPEDFVVMSIQQNCVRQRDTPFEIPANLPSCPNGECTCAWFWQGKNSAAEMYMVGFRCKVQNGIATAFPIPSKPKRGAISGATQPMYWANDNSNIGYTPTYDDRPSYNSRYGWVNGAQASAFSAGAGNTTSINPIPSTSSTRTSSIAASSTRPNGVSSGTTSSLGSRPSEFYQHIAEPSSSSAQAPKKTKVCRRGHLKRRSREHV